MATRTVTKSGNSTIYTITDVAGNAMTVTQTQNLGQAVYVSAAGSPVLQDASENAAQLMLLLATGLTPLT
jgi:hypothetical protein